MARDGNITESYADILQQLYLLDNSKFPYKDASGDFIDSVGTVGVLPFITVGVTDSGADYECDGTADQEQINLALTEAETAGGGTVIMLTGNYSINGVIQLPNNVTLAGEGYENVSITLANGTDTHCIVNKDVGGISYSVIRDISVSGNRANQTDTTLTTLSLTDSANVRIIGCSFSGSKGNAIELHGCSDIAFIETFIGNCDKSGLYIDDSNYSIVNLCMINGTKYHGISFVGGSDYAVITFNKIIDCCSGTANTYSGISVADSGVLNRYITIDGNNITDSQSKMKYGIETLNLSDYCIFGYNQIVGMVTGTISTVGNNNIYAPSRIPGLVSATSTYSITSSAVNTVNCTSGTFAVTLPTAVGQTSRIINVKNSGSGVITINTTSSQTIDGGASGTLTLNQYEGVTVQSDGTNRIIL